MVVDRESRTALTREFPVLNEKRGKEYGKYLQTPHWRRTRNAALMRAGYACDDCGKRSGLQVHHLTYERIGAELPADLCVLCDPCHGDAHVRLAIARGTPAIRRDVLLRLASLALTEDAAPESVASLVDAVKVRCAQLRIAYDAATVWATVTDLANKREIVFPAPPREPRPAPPPPDPGGISKRDAHQLLQWLCSSHEIKTFPAPDVMPAGAVDAFRQACGLWNRPDLDPKACRPPTVDPLPLPRVLLRMTDTRHDDDKGGDE